MGIFSKIGDAISGVFKGILSIFKPILEPLGKLMNSSFGKALMIGLSIFTLGTAMVAGYTAFSANMATNGFMTAFVESGKAFLTTLTGVGGGEGGIFAPNETTAKAMMKGSGPAADATALAMEQGGSPGVAGQSGIQGADSALEGSGGLLNEANMSGSRAMGPPDSGAATTALRSDQVGVGGGSIMPPEAGDPAIQMAANANANPPVTDMLDEGTNWLSKAKKAAGEMFDEGGFLRSEGGGRVAGALISGVGNYYTSKDQQEFDDRIRRDWMNPNSQGRANIRQQSARVGRLQVPNAQDIARVSRNTAKEGQGRMKFDRAYGATAGG